MGLNIMIYDAVRPATVPASVWDCGKFSGDREFADMVSRSELPHIKKTIFEEAHYRPSDFAAWRKTLDNIVWANPGRFERLTTLLEENKDWWIYFSY